MDCIYECLHDITLRKRKEKRNSDFALYYAGDSNFTEKFNFAEVL